MNKLLSFFASTKLSAILIILFSIGMAVATFIENDFGTPAARKLVFDALWFEVVIGLLAVNFIGNIQKYRMWKRESWPVLLFHLSFVVIIIGAGISRMISFEGIMHIREGQQSSEIISDKTYLQVLVNDSASFEKPLLLTTITDNSFRWDINTEFGDFTIDYVQFIPHATEVYKPSENGIPVIHLIASGNNSGRTDVFLKNGEIKNVFGTTISFNSPGKADIYILPDSADHLLILPHHDINYMQMSDQSRGIAKADTLNPLLKQVLYMHESMNFVFDTFMKSAERQIISSNKEEDKNKEDALIVNISSGSENQEIILTGMRGVLSPKRMIHLNDMQLAINYGSKPIKTPFSIHLNDFQLERYPGSMSPASFASEVEVIDGSTRFPYRIFMNNVLDHKGYRFFQASYDMDELGTVLSVNHDFLGTMVTYIGYGLMILGMMIAPFWKGSRFKKLVQALGSKTTLLILFLSFVTLGKESFASERNTDSLLVEQNIPQEHADKFSAILIQDEGGRIKPISTVASEVLRKLQKTNTFRGYSANQVFLALHTNPMDWSEMPIIKISKGKHNISHLIHLEGDNARYIDFFEKDGTFLLSDKTDEIVRKRAAMRTEEDKLVLEVSQRVTLLYEIFNGKHLKMFPMPNDSTNKWYSYTDFNVGFQGEDSTFVYQILPYYFGEVRKSRASGDWSSPDEIIDYLSKFQTTYGKAVLPSDRQINAEIYYNKYEIFNKLYRYYGLVGLIMMILLIIQLTRETKWTKIPVQFFSAMVILMFLLHTLGLGARWYISGHAPWSDAYESMVYVAWSTVLVGILFIKKSKITLAATAIMASVFLMVAHWSWMDPEIGNLVPVLNSYWLMIHVAIIVASYGPFTLNFLLGIIVLILVIVKTNKNQTRIESQVLKLTQINELIMIIGVFLLAIGTFLGGVWANESWGRYWSWDPKETWALISVMIYTFVLHMRLIPGLRGLVPFNIAGTFAYASIMMTYFGVNYYLAGMHSYAKGDPVPVPDFVYYSIALLTLISGVAYWRGKKGEKS